MASASPVSMNPAPRRRPAKSRAGTLLDWLPLLLFYSLFLPTEVSVTIAGFSLYAYRVVLLVFVPFVVHHMLQGRFRLTFVDLTMIAAGLWIIFATGWHYGLDVGLSSGGPLALDYVLAYLVGRCFFPTPLALRRLLYFGIPVVLIVGLSLVVEAVANRYIVRPLLGAVFGNSPAAALARLGEVRLGLMRATGPFLHPISGGLFMGSLLPLYFYADLPRRGWLGICGSLCAFFTVSSAAIVSVVLSVGAIVYDRMRRFTGFGWGVVAAVVLFLIVCAEVLTESGAARIIIRTLALNPATGYARLLIWDYGWADVGRHPMFGIGMFDDYQRPSWMNFNSVDNFWLLLALRYGIPGLCLLVLVLVGSLVACARAPRSAEPESRHARPMRNAICISLIISALLLFTSSPWGAEIVWFYLLTGIAGGLAQGRRMPPAYRREGGQPVRAPVAQQPPAAR